MKLKPDVKATVSDMLMAWSDRLEEIIDLKPGQLFRLGFLLYEGEKMADSCIITTVPMPKRSKKPAPKKPKKK